MRQLKIPSQFTGPSERTRFGQSETESTHVTAAHCDLRRIESIDVTQSTNGIHGFDSLQKEIDCIRTIVVLVQTQRSLTRSLSRIRFGLTHDKIFDRHEQQMR